MSAFSATLREQIESLNSLINSSFNLKAKSPNYGLLHFIEKHYPYSKAQKFLLSTKLVSRHTVLYEIVRQTFLISNEKERVDSLYNLIENIFSCFSLSNINQLSGLQSDKNNVLDLATKIEDRVELARLALFAPAFRALFSYTVFDNSNYTDVLYKLIAPKRFNDIERCELSRIGMVSLADAGLLPYIWLLCGVQNFQTDLGVQFGQYLSTDVNLTVSLSLSANSQSVILPSESTKKDFARGRVQAFKLLKDYYSKCQNENNVKYLSQKFILANRNWVMTILQECASLSGLIQLSMFSKKQDNNPIDVFDFLLYLKDIVILGYERPEDFLDLSEDALQYLPEMIKAFYNIEN